MRADACRAAPTTTGAAPSRGTREKGSGLVLISCYGGVGAGFDVQCGCHGGGGPGSSSTRRRRSKQRGVRPRRGLGPARRMNRRSRTCAEITGGGRATGLHVNVDLVKRRTNARRCCAPSDLPPRRAPRPAAPRAKRLCLRVVALASDVGLGELPAQCLQRAGSEQQAGCVQLTPRTPNTAGQSAYATTWAMHARGQSTRHRKVPRASSTGAPARRLREGCGVSSVSI